MLAAQSTCYLGVKPARSLDGNTKAYGAGTAFFVGPTTLITAAHVVPDNKRRIVAQLPGTRRATTFVESLFNRSPPPIFETFECKCIGTGLPDADVAILQVVGPYRTNVYLEIEQGGMNPDDLVDIVGYPGVYSEHYVQSMHHGPIDGELVDDVFALFPKSQLVVTHGPVVLGGIMPTYRVSSVSGMSGSPVIMNGKVKGKNLPNMGINAIGVHIGASSRSTNRCVSFQWSVVETLLQVHGLIGKIH